MDMLVNFVFMTEKPIDRLLRRLAEMGKSEADFCREFGITAQRLNNWKKRGIAKHQLIPVATYIGRSAEWLEKGGMDAKSYASERGGQEKIDREQSEWLRILGLLSPRQKQVIRSVISEFQLDRRHHSVPVETDHRTGADRREFIGKVIQAGAPLGRRVSRPNTNIHDLPEEPKKTSRLPEDEDAK
jgi:hypothetical protein